MPDTVIIGAGLTGLAAAYYLEQKGLSDIIILEKQTTPGGLLRSARINGFTFDYTGHFIHVNNETFHAFLADIGKEKELTATSRKSAIYTHNIKTPYPFQMNLYGLPSTVITECIAGFVERKTHIKKPKTFVQWVQKHFGDGLGKHFFYPFQKKILSYDLRRIEPSWTGRFVPKTDLQSMLTRAVVPSQQQNIGYNAQFYYPTSGGIDWLIKHTIKKLRTQIHTQAQVTRIDPLQKKITLTNGKTISYRTLISTMPLNKLLTSLSKSTRHTLAAQARKLKHTSVLNINLGIKRPTLEDVHWLYFPQTHYPFYRLGFWHNVCHALTPPNMSAIYTECSYLPGSQATQCRAALAEKTMGTVAKLFSFTEQEIILRHDLLLHHAYVIYDQWRKQNISKILTQLKKAHILSIGRYGAWKYSSMQEAVLDGKQAAEEVAQHYATPHRTHKDL